ncbi:MAG: hypothetical protein D3910_01855 [Candidatus Electrothrix sp. ATG2]|nr:hypothetical protein [Candidatus Electrothrix sp. ATG2]
MLANFVLENKMFKFMPLFFKNRSVVTVSLLCVPLLFIMLAINIRALHGPLYQANFSDPSYAYLLNSLNITNGESPGHIDHPGTTVQLLGGGVLYLSVLIGKITGDNTSITDKVLTDPERYITQITNVLVSILTIAIFLFGLQIYRETKHLWISIIAQMFPLTSSTLLEYLPRLQPEPLLVACAFLLAAVLVPFVTGTVDRSSSGTKPFLAGVIIAFGVVTKVTFIPLCVFLLVFCSKKQNVIALVAFVCTLFILTIPIWDSISQVYSWLVDVMTHSGRYGSGEVGLPELSKLFKNGIHLFKTNPVIFYFIPILLVSLFIRKRSKKYSAVNRFILFSLLVLITSILITVKHYAPHYIVPTIAFSGFFVFISIFYFSWKKINFLIFFVFIIGSLLLFKYNKQTESKLLRHKIIHSDYSWLQERSQKHDCRLVSYYRSSLPEYALLFGNDFSRRVYGEKLMAIYPENLSYNIWEKKFYNFRGGLSEPDVNNLHKQSNPVCLLGTGKLPYQGEPNVELLEKKGKLVLYKFLGFNKKK